jgi:hypothetical protein
MPLFLFSNSYQESALSSTESKEQRNSIVDDQNNLQIHLTHEYHVLLVYLLALTQL